MGIFGHNDWAVDPSASISPTYTYGGRPPRPDGMPAQCTAQLNPRPNIVGSASSVSTNTADSFNGFLSRAIQSARRDARYNRMMSGATTARGAVGARPAGNSAASRASGGRGAAGSFSVGSGFGAPAAPQAQESVWGSAMRELRGEFSRMATEVRNEFQTPSGWNRGITGGGPSGGPGGGSGSSGGGARPGPLPPSGPPASFGSGQSMSFQDIVNAARRAAESQRGGGQGPDSFWGRP